MTGMRVFIRTLLHLLTSSTFSETQVSRQFLIHPALKCNLSFANYKQYITVEICKLFTDSKKRACRCCVALDTV